VLSKAVSTILFYVAIMPLILIILVPTTIYCILLIIREREMLKGRFR
jgi:hypothetical protein